jgi:hypothetical protein
MQHIGDQMVELFCNYVSLLWCANLWRAFKFGDELGEVSPAGIGDTPQNNTCMQ